jgi:hypothetical protein
MMASPPVKRHLDFASRKGSFFLYLNESFLFLASDQGSHCESSGGIWFRLAPRRPSSCAHEEA